MLRVVLESNWCWKNELYWSKACELWKKNEELWSCTLVVVTVLSVGVETTTLLKSERTSYSRINDSVNRISLEQHEAL